MADAAIATGLEARVRALPGGLGAELDGVGIADIGPGNLAAFLDLLHRRQVLVFRDQHPDPKTYVEFAARLGPIQPHVINQFRLDGHPEIYVISNLVENGKPVGNADGGFEWHTDMAVAEYPMAYTMLYTLEAPREGADTIFASTRVAYEALDADERKRLRPLDVVRSFSTLYDDKSYKPADPKNRVETDVVHPLVRTHPATGQDALYISQGDMKGVTGLPAGEGLALVERLVAETTAPERVYRHKWRAGDIVIWDNRALLHAATPYDKKNERRLVWRISVRGERPFRKD